METMASAAGVCEVEPIPIPIDVIKRVVDVIKRVVAAVTSKRLEAPGQEKLKVELGRVGPKVVLVVANVITVPRVLIVAPFKFNTPLGPLDVNCSVPSMAAPLTS